jgi:hypothetical protein
LTVIYPKIITLALALIILFFGDFKKERTSLFVRTSCPRTYKRQYEYLAKFCDNFCETAPERVYRTSSESPLPPKTDFPKFEGKGSRLTLHSSFGIELFG